MTTVAQMLDQFVPVHFPKLARRTQIDGMRHVEILSDSADLGAASELLQHGDVRLTKRIYDRSVRIVQPLR